MAVIDDAQAQAAPQQPQEQAPPPQHDQQQQPSGQAQDVILACYGMLYDKRMAMGERLAALIKDARDPIAVVATSAHDLVAAASEKTGLQLEQTEFKMVVMMVLARVLELAVAVGVEISDDDAARAGQIMIEKMNGAGQPAPQGAPA